MSIGNPTIVLVHGAFGDSGMWTDVIAKLHAPGYPTIAVANPLRALESDSQYTVTIAKSVDGPVVLVGHSYSGASITGAARDASKVGALVYVAAVQPGEGESALQNLSRFPGSKMGGEAMAATSERGGFGGMLSEVVVSNALRDAALRRASCCPRKHNSRMQAELAKPSLIVSRSITCSSVMRAPALRPSRGRTESLARGRGPLRFSSGAADVCRLDQNRGVR